MAAPRQKATSARATSKSAARKRPQRRPHSATPKQRVQATQGGSHTAPGDFPTVGIGASAGGLEALEEFCRHMPPTSGMAFVVVTHQHPTHTSLMPELLRKYTTMQIMEATDSVQLQPDCVYMARPGHYLSIRYRTLYLVEPGESASLRLPIDYFLRALAQDQGHKAIAIILSGTGTDGTLGVKAIKGESGMVMAQTEASAKYAGMPRSAMATGLVDYVLSAAEMPPQLLSYVTGSYRQPSVKPDVAEAPLREALQQILVLLRHHTKHDFSVHKTTTIRRRVERRMNVHQVETPNHYVRYLREHPQELDILFKELLIGVTTFFRDPEAFVGLADALRQHIIAKPSDAILRIWVPGCSTGEEAYSIAIILRELSEEVGTHLTVQIFATDLDSQAIETARAGLYPDGIAVDVSKERLQHFFTKEDSSYRIKTDIREMVIFAPQNLLTDPPFTRLDLLSCRNLLIYLDSEAQKRLISLFHYALSAHGFLFLGSSESIGGFGDLFTTLDKKWKLFHRTEVISVFPAMTNFTGVTPERHTDLPALTQSDRTPPMPDLARVIDKLLLQLHVPASVLVTPNGDIVYIHGRTGMFLEPTPGHPKHNILSMAREGLQLELAAALRNAAARTTTVTCPRIQVQTNGGFIQTDVVVQYLSEPESLQGLLLVTFRQVLEIPVPLRHP